MGNECCTSRGSIEPLERYFGVPLSTLCTYEASLLSVKGPSEAHAFHVAMIDATGGSSVQNRSRSREQHHNVPLIVLSICARLKAVGVAVPCTIQHFTNSTMQQWVERSRLATNHTFVTDKKQWKEWKKKVKKLHEEATGGDGSSPGDGDYERYPLNPIGKVLEVSGANGVQCCALIACFLKQLPAPLISPVMLTELERTLALGDAEGLVAFSALWNSTFASSYPTEHATLGALADVFYLLAASSPTLAAVAPNNSGGGQTPSRTRSIEHAVENDLWRSTIDAFMRSSEWIRAFAHGTTRPNRAPESTRATEELLYRAIGDAIFCVRYRGGGRLPRGDAAESSRRRDAVNNGQSGTNSGGGHPSGPAGGGTTQAGNRQGPSTGTSTQPPSREPYSEKAAQPVLGVADRNEQPVASGGPSSPTSRATGGEQPEQLAATAPSVNGHATEEDSSSSSSSSSESEEDERRAPSTRRSVAGDAPPKSASPLDRDRGDHHDDDEERDGNASVGIHSDEGRASQQHHRGTTTTARSRQSSVALSALSATPHHQDLQPLQRHAQHAPQEMLEDDDTIHGSNTGGGGVGGERTSKRKKKPVATGPSAAHRLELAKAAFSVGVDRPTAQQGAAREKSAGAVHQDAHHHHTTDVVNTTRTTSEANHTLTTTHLEDPSGAPSGDEYSPRDSGGFFQTQNEQHQTYTTTTALGNHRNSAGDIDVKTRYELFMVEASEIITTLQKEAEESKMQLRRCSTLVEDALPHRGFRDRTQQTLEELATHGAEIGDEVLSLKKQVTQLQQQLDVSNKDRDCLAAEAAAARFSASEVILKFVDMERALLHHQQSIRYLERKVMDADDGMSKADTNSRTLRVDVDALQRRVLYLRDHL
ncbi:Hypothetical protein, putative [Bodo saltans]|uniref:Uncharacterized protein n=1 Tax=Bodo saltans TaxID=75058 RepID=A0A0S4J489_BODSA|nr:Hypothetical protein, putative [Bodo saltans]|eukprot:CUG77100.1 Hypothetical protein, putative [Bodo saltans]